MWSSPPQAAVRNFRMLSPVKFFSSSTDAADSQQAFLPPDVPRDGEDMPPRRRAFTPQKVLHLLWIAPPLPFCLLRSSVIERLQRLCAVRN